MGLLRSNKVSEQSEKSLLRSNKVSEQSEKSLLRSNKVSEQSEESLLRSNKVPEPQNHLVRGEGFLSTSIRSDVNNVRQGEIVVVRNGKLTFKLRLGNPIRREGAEISKLFSPEVLNLLGDELEGAEVFVRVKPTGTAREGSFAVIIPPDEENGLEIHRGKTETEATKKAQGSKRALNGALFMEIDEETIAEITETADQASQTAESL